MTQWVQRLIIANVLVFLVAGSARELYASLVLVPQIVFFRPWTVVTYMFLHGGFWHLFLNMLGLFFFGPRLEARLGPRAFLTLYFCSGLGGALFSFLPPMAPVVGASGAVFGVLLGFARYWPNEPIYIWGVLPVQARWLIIFLAAFSLYGGSHGGPRRGGPLRAPRWVRRRIPVPTPLGSTSPVPDGREAELLLQGKRRARHRGHGGNGSRSRSTTFTS